MTDVGSTYRLQLHAGFTLADVRALVPYLARLGITHLHCSPILQARPGSTHGYDVTDPDRLNPELGSDDDLRALVKEAHGAGLGIVLDIVPNHMAASRDNWRWEEVLRFGPASRYGRWFDVDWRAVGDRELHNRVLLPVLGDMRAHVLARDEIAVAFDDGEPRIHYYENSFPVDPGTAPALLDRALPACARELGADHPDVRELGTIVVALRRLPARDPKAIDRMDERRTRAVELMARLGALRHNSPPVRGCLDRAAADFGAGPEGRRRLRRLLDAQNYQLVFWRRASRELNYRRFFDVNELIALHMEDPVVFGEHHRQVLEWIERGWVDGLRIDHPDGLLDPLGYLHRLADEGFEWRPDGRYPIWVEKILSHGELLRQGWPVSGTTGYDFLNEVEAIFIAPDGYARIEADYRRTTRRPLPYDAIARLAKRRVLESSLQASVRLLARRLLRLRPADAVPPLPVHGAMRAIVDTIVHLPVYRTYVDPLHPVPDAEERRLLETAIQGARGEGRAPAAALDLLEAVLLAHEGPWREAGNEQARVRFVQRFQQVSGPATAKGLEDTAFYVYVPLLSRNEVGGEPGAPLDDPVAAFHRSCAYRAAHLPASMLGVTTHDTKRTADVRARIDVLSEVPDEWEAALYRLRRLARAHKGRVNGRAVPDVNTEYLFYQNLLGIWPVESARPEAPGVPDDAGLATLRERMQTYMLKAVREAKVHTSWVDPDEPWEQALAAYVDAVLTPATGGPVLDVVARLAARVGRPGLWTSLARTVLQLTAPGVPDVYQGDELWNQALVDPDNRRPVDYDRRRLLQARLEERWSAGEEERRRLLAELVAAPEDGRIKLHVLGAGLRARRMYAELFRSGNYLPLEAEGPAAAHLVAFARVWETTWLVVVVPRLMLRLTGDPARSPTEPRLWEGTAVRLSAEAPEGPWRCVLSDGNRVATGGRLAAGDLFAELPVAMLGGGS